MMLATPKDEDLTPPAGRATTGWSRRLFGATRGYYLRTYVTSLPVGPFGTFHCISRGIPAFFMIFHSREAGRGGYCRTYVTFCCTRAAGEGYLRTYVTFHGVLSGLLSISSDLPAAFFFLPDTQATALGSSGPFGFLGFLCYTLYSQPTKFKCLHDVPQKAGGRRGAGYNNLVSV